MKTRANNQDKKVNSRNTRFSGGDSRPLLTVEMLSDSSLYPKGTIKNIRAQKAILGRDPACALAFGDDDDTVSSKHATLEFSNHKYYLIHLSQSNPTILNGYVIEDVGTRHLLKSGDEIQLSRIGPRFRVSFSEQKNTNLTQRIHTFVKNTLWPYKIALTILLVFFLTALGLLAYQYFRYEPLLTLTTTIQKQHAADTEKIVKLNRQNTDLQNLLKKDLEFRKPARIVNRPQPATLPTSDIGEKIKKLNGSIYMVKAKSLLLQYPDGSEQRIELKNGQGWTGTGFLCTDGRFVTARHVIEPWFFFGKNEIDMIKLNLIVTQGGKVSVSYEAKSSNMLSFQFTNYDFAVNRGLDCSTIGTTASGESVALIKAPTTSDWAVMSTKFKSGIVVLSTALSEAMPQAEMLHVLGFPSGDTFQENGTIEPLYSTTTVAQTGTKKGFINVSNRTFDAGTSGGPVFALVDGKFWAVGIIVAKTGDIGRIIPVSVLP